MCEAEHARWGAIRRAIHTDSGCNGTAAPGAAGGGWDRGWSHRAGFQMMRRQARWSRVFSGLPVRPDAGWPPVSLRRRSPVDDARFDRFARAISGLTSRSSRRRVP